MCLIGSHEKSFCYILSPSWKNALQGCATKDPKKALNHIHMSDLWTISTPLTCFRDKFAAWAEQSKWIGNLYTRLYVSKGLWDIWPCANGWAVVIPRRRLPKFYTLNHNSSSLWRPFHPEATFSENRDRQKAPSHHVMAEVWCLPGDLALNLLQWEELGTTSPLGPFWDASWTEQPLYMKAPFMAYYETHCLLAKVWPGQLSSNACWW